MLRQNTQNLRTNIIIIDFKDNLPYLIFKKFNLIMKNT